MRGGMSVPVKQIRDPEIPSAENFSFDWHAGTEAPQSAPADIVPRAA
jgi:hypothetical protein